MADKAARRRGWLCVADAAYYVGVSPDRLRGAVNRGELAAYEVPDEGRGRTGAHTLARFSPDDLDAWVRSWPEARFDATAPRVVRKAC